MDPETYAISKAGLTLKEEGFDVDNMQYDLTQSAEAFPAREFHFVQYIPPNVRT